MLIFTTSCVKDESLENKNDEDIKIDFVDPAIVKTEADKKKAEIILSVTKTLRRIYKDRQIVDEVNAAIATGYYQGETILLKDLLDPENSPVYNSASFISSRSSRSFKIGSFKEAFEREFPKNSISAGRVSDSFFDEGGVSIYFPYSEDTQYLPDAIAVVPGTVEADQAYIDNPECSDEYRDDCWPRYTLVNDNYASGKPTHIIGMGATVSGGNNYTINCTGNMLVKIGEMKVTKQYDKLISFTGNGAGSEIKIGRIGTAAVTNASQQVTDFQGDIITPTTFKRREIRNGTWKSIYATWDTNWTPDQINQSLAIWEEDTQGTKTFGGSLSKTISGATVSVNYNISVITQDEIIRNWNIDRVFLTTFGVTDQGHGFRNNWPIQDGGTTVAYTIPLSCY